STRTTSSAPLNEIEMLPSYSRRARAMTSCGSLPLYSAATAARLLVSSAMPSGSPSRVARASAASPSRPPPSPPPHSTTLPGAARSRKGRGRTGGRGRGRHRAAARGEGQRRRGRQELRLARDDREARPRQLALGGEQLDEVSQAIAIGLQRRLVA